MRMRGMRRVGSVLRGRSVVVVVVAVLVVAGIVANGTRGCGECYRGCIVRRFSLPFVPSAGHCPEKLDLIYCGPHCRRLVTSARGCLPFLHFELRKTHRPNTWNDIRSSGSRCCFWIRFCKIVIALLSAGKIHSSFFAAVTRMLFVRSDGCAYRSFVCS